MVYCETSYFIDIQKKIRFFNCLHLNPILFTIKSTYCFIINFCLFYIVFLVNILNTAVLLILSSQAVSQFRLFFFILLPILGKTGNKFFEKKNCTDMQKVVFITSLNLAELLSI